jgi:hypothetical protein
MQEHLTAGSRHTHTQRERDSVFQRSLYREEKSNSVLLRTVIQVETCLNVLKHVSV